ncbi:MAG: glutamyl-tRNA reductase [Clostridiales bacterium]
MNIVMVGIDYKITSIELRENISFTSIEVRKSLLRMKENYNISGVVIISTCNRTEVYISYDKSEVEIDPISFFCEAAKFCERDFKNHLYIKKDEKAMSYLFELACGIHSMIFGEDQIISQVKEAIHIAKEEKASDATLNTLFRYVVTCAKKVKTQLVLRSVSPSVASYSIKLLEEFISKNYKTKALVIGNGVIGRMVCEELLLKGCKVFVTKRTCNNKETIVPIGCITIDYEQRETLIHQVDILISATSSPHQTISHKMIAVCEKKPEYVIDLAVPRDIDPEIQRIEGMHYYNIDTLGKTGRRDNSKEIESMKILIREYMGKFQKWKDNKRVSLNNFL